MAGFYSMSPEVMAFALEMDRAIKANADVADKGDSWKGMDNLELLGFMEDNVQELCLAANVDGAGPAILRRAVNVANYAMMVAANNGLLPQEAPCWLCGVVELDRTKLITITTEKESPNGPSCEPKDVLVHPGCHQDMNA